MSRRSHGRERGAALLLVLWVFMILGVIALDFARYMREDAMAAINFAEETSGYYVALAGMNRALFDAERLREENVRPINRTRGEAPDIDEEEPPVLVPPDGEWHEGTYHEGEAGGGRWSVRMTDEGGRISLNRASEFLLTRVVTYILQGGEVTAGQNRQASNEVASVVDAILDWIDTDDLERMHGAESEFYLKRRLPHEAKNGFFDTPEELLKVRGVTPQLFFGTDGVPGLRDVVSVYSRARTVNVRTAPRAVLQVLLGLDSEETDEMFRQRDEDGVPLLQLVQAQLGAVDPGMANLLVDQPPRIVYVEARGDASKERNQSRVAMVADLNSEISEGVRVLRWLDRAPWVGTLGFPAPADGDDG